MSLYFEVDMYWFSYSSLYYFVVFVLARVSFFVLCCGCWVFVGLKLRCLFGGVFGWKKIIKEGELVGMWYLSIDGVPCF